MFSSIIQAVRGLFKSETYGSALEEYIVSHHPQNVCDVEKLTMEYHYKKESFL